MRVIHYRWHPLHGREVLVGVDDRYPGAVRCFADGAFERFSLVPVWMLDESRCARMELSTEARVAWQALAELKRLLDDAQPAAALDERSLAGRDAGHETTNPPSSAGTGISSSSAAGLEIAASGVPRGARAVAGAPDQARRAARPCGRTRRGGRR